VLAEAVDWAPLRQVGQGRDADESGRACVAELQCEATVEFDVARRLIVGVRRERVGAVARRAFRARALLRDVAARVAEEKARGVRVERTPSERGGRAHRRALPTAE